MSAPRCFYCGRNLDGMYVQHVKGHRVCPNKSFCIDNSWKGISLWDGVHKPKNMYRDSNLMTKQSVKKLSKFLRRCKNECKIKIKKG